jgi:hypothetical protein
MTVLPKPEHHNKDTRIGSDVKLPNEGICDLKFNRGKIMPEKTS